MNNIGENIKGQYIRCSVSDDQEYSAYVPPPLPPALDMERLSSGLARASVSLGRLDGILGSSAIAPSLTWVISAFVGKEATLSSQIEGTQSSLSDLFEAEALEFGRMAGSDAQQGMKGLSDVGELLGYVDAMNYSLKRVKELPISTRLLREVHAKLMAGSIRGNTKSPGEFRTIQNWIGGTKPSNAVFVPPPPMKIKDCLTDLANYYHDNSQSVPILIKAAIVHAQFETIHPFLDGNGRLGRLLVTLMLCSEGELKEPVLYLSLFFKKHKSTYYDRLQGVRTSDDWSAWVEFFLEGVEDTAVKAHALIHGLLRLFEDDKGKIIKENRHVSSVLDIHSVFQKHPVATIDIIISATKLSRPTVQRSVAVMEDLEIIREITGRRRGRLFVYKAYLTALEDDD